MVEQVIWLLIYLALLVGLVYLVLWTLTALGLSLPPMIVRVIWVIAVLIAILLLWRALSPLIGGGGVHMFPH
jgi:hypothetical protein